MNFGSKRVATRDSRCEKTVLKNKEILKNIYYIYSINLILFFLSFGTYFIIRET